MKIPRSREAKPVAKQGKVQSPNTAELLIFQHHLDMLLLLIQNIMHLEKHSWFLNAFIGH